MKIYKVPHYNEAKHEVIEIIENYNLDFSFGNAVKYLLRAGLKYATPLEDILKAKYYLRRCLEQNTIPRKRPKNPIKTTDIIFDRKLSDEVYRALESIFDALSTKDKRHYQSIVRKGILEALDELKEYK